MLKVTSHQGPCGQRTLFSLSHSEVVNIMLTRFRYVPILPNMEDTIDYTHSAAVLFENVRDLLASGDPRTRIRAAAWFAQGVGLLEQRVVSEAHQSGLSWAQIGDVYGVSRQAVHRRFSDTTYLTSESFDELLDDLASEPEAVPSLSRAAARARRNAS